MANKITVTSAGNKVNVSTNPDMSMFYTERSREWAISDKIVNNEDYSSKYYANESKKQADISTAKTTEVIESGNTAVSNIENAKTNAITDITNQEVLSIDNVKIAGTTQINLIAEQITLATAQASIATEKANIATSHADIATAKTTEVVESGNTALSNIATAKNNVLNDINTTGAGYVNDAEQYAQNALTSANNASNSENNALLYKNSASESSQTATEQAQIASAKANEATTSATNAKTSETNAKSSEVRCEEILTRLGTSIKIKGRVDSFGDLPLSGNLDGDTYLIGEEGLNSYPEYYWYSDHWEFMGTTTSLVWGSITGDISAQTDLTNKLNSKQDVLSTYQLNAANSGITAAKVVTYDAYASTIGGKADDSIVVHNTGNETISGIKTFTGNPVFSNDAFGGQLSVNRTNNTGGYSVVKFLNGDTVKGYLGIDNNGNPVYCNPSNTSGYNLVRNSTLNTAVGSATKPVYINSTGVATAITSYEGNSASATKATQDSSGNQINTSYMPLKYSKYSISIYKSSNPYIKLATYTNTSTMDHCSVLFWVEILSANINKAYALCKFSFERRNSLANTSFEILEKYGYSSLFEVFDTLTIAYSIASDTVCEIWMKTLTNTYNSYYIRPTECNEYGDYGQTSVTMANNKWTYYNKSGTSTSVASTAITSGYTQVVITDKSTYTALNDKAEKIELDKKVDISSLTECHVVVEKSDESLLPSWYRVYSDGWCEQGGRTASNVNAPQTVTFLKSFKDLNYNSSSGISGTGSNNGNSYPIITLHKTITSMVIENHNSGTGANNYYEWEAKGYIK